MVPNSLVLIDMLHAPRQQGLRDRACESRHVEERFHQREDELKRGRALDLERRALAELRVLERAARDSAVAVRADFDHEPRDDRRLIGRGEVRGVLGAGSELLRAGHFSRLCRTSGRMQRRVSEHRERRPLDKYEEYRPEGATSQVAGLAALWMLRIAREDQVAESIGLSDRGRDRGECRAFRLDACPSGGYKRSVELSDLRGDERLALVALLKVAVVADGSVSDEEVEEIGDVVEAFGEGEYRKLVDEVSRRFQSQDELKTFLETIERREARELIYGFFLEEAATEALRGRESELVAWLAEAWEIEVEIDDGEAP